MCFFHFLPSSEGICFKKCALLMKDPVLKQSFSCWRIPMGRRVYLPIHEWLIFIAHVGTWSPSHDLFSWRPIPPKQCLFQWKQGSSPKFNSEFTPEKWMVGRWSFPIGRNLAFFFRGEPLNFARVRVIWVPGKYIFNRPIEKYGSRARSRGVRWSWVIEKHCHPRVTQFISPWKTLTKWDLGVVFRSFMCQKLLNSTFF